MSKHVTNFQASYSASKLVPAFYFHTRAPKWRTCDLCHTRTGQRRRASQSSHNIRLRTSHTICQKQLHGSFGSRNEKRCTSSSRLRPASVYQLGEFEVDIDSVDESAIRKAVSELEERHHLTGQEHEASRASPETIAGNKAAGITNSPSPEDDRAALKAERRKSLEKELRDLKEQLAKETGSSSQGTAASVAGSSWRTWGSRQGNHGHGTGKKAPETKIKASQEIVGTAVRPQSKTLAAKKSGERVERVKAFFRTLPSSVVIVTASSPQYKYDEARHGLDSLMRQRDLRDFPSKDMRAMTVSSLTSVSMNPEPVISFNIKLPSSTWDAIQHWKRFRIHNLCVSWPAWTLAKLFSEPNWTERIREPPYSSIEFPKTLAYWPSPKPETPTSSGGKPPMLFGDNKIAQSHLECRLLPEKTVEIGDHVVLFATARTPFLHTTTQCSPKFNALIHCNRDYWELGENARVTKCLPEKLSSSLAS